MSDINYSIKWRNIGYAEISYFIGIALYLSLSLIFFNTYVSEFYIDTISYLNIAKKYSEGHFIEALNAYWSPLISWLLVPFYWLNIDPFMGFRIINLIVGLLLLLLIIKLFSGLNFSKITRVFCFITFCIFTLFYQLSSFSPDFISIFFIILYLFLLTNPERHSNKYYFIKVGISGLLGFFAKSYFLSFFIVQFLLFNLWEWYLNKGQRKIILLNTIKTFSLFFLIAGIWIGLLSYKYQKFTISSSATYNFSILHTTGEIGSKNQYYDVGLIAPPDRYSASSWDDPTYYPLKKRHLFESIESIQFQLRLILYNLDIAKYLFRWFSYFGITLLLLLLYVPIVSKRESKNIVSVFILSAFLYLMGYLMIFYEERYTLPSYFLLILCTYYVLDEILVKYSFNKIVAASLLMLLSVSFLKNPFHGIRELKRDLNQLDLCRKAVMKLNNADWLRKKNYASIYEYQMPMLIAFLNNGYSYGWINKNHSMEETRQSLFKYKIDYFFYFDIKTPPIKNIELTNQIPDYLKNKPVVYKDDVLNLTVFKMH